MSEKNTGRGESMFSFMVMVATLVFVVVASVFGQLLGGGIFRWFSGLIRGEKIVSTTGLTESHRNAFFEECVKKGSSSERCGCIFNNLKDDISLRDLRELADETKNFEDFSDEIEDAIQSCPLEITIKDEQCGTEVGGQEMYTDWFDIRSDKWSIQVDSLAIPKSVKPVSNTRVWYTKSPIPINEIITNGKSYKNVYFEVGEGRPHESLSETIEVVGAGRYRLRILCWDTKYKITIKELIDK